VSLAIPFSLMGGIMLSVFWLPVVFVVYWLVRIMRTRKPGIATVGRHVRLAPKKERSAQTSSYWTVNPDPFRDDGFRE
jgi:hypothetical protein